MSPARWAVAVVFALSLIGASVWWAMSGSPDDLEAKVRSELPGTICGGTVAPEDAMPVEYLRWTATQEQFRPAEGETPGSVPGHLYCRIGDPTGKWPLLNIGVSTLDAQNLPFTNAVKYGHGSPMGAGLTGMGDPEFAWVVVPCSGPTGDLVASTFMSRPGKSERRAYDLDDIAPFQTQLATLLVRTANRVAAGAGCGQQLPDPAPIAEWGKVTASKEATAACRPLFAGAGSSLTSLKSWSTPQTPAPVERCKLLRGSAPRAGDSVATSTTYRGRLAELLLGKPEVSMSVVDMGDPVVRTVGTCGGERVVWYTAVERHGSYDSELAPAHDRLVEAAVREHGCVVTERTAGR